MWQQHPHCTPQSILTLFTAGIVMCSLLSCKPALTLLTHEGEKELKEDFPVSPQGPWVILFAFDGVGYNELMQALRSEEFSYGRTLFGAEKKDGVFEHGYSVPNAISILPSTTMAAWASIYTGQPPARTGVSGNEWFVREQMQFYAPGPVSVHDTDHFLAMFTEGLVGNLLQTPTLYEQVGLRSHVSLAPVYRGASLFTSLDSTALVDLMTNFITGTLGDAPMNREVYATIDEESTTKLINALKEHGIPNLQVVYFPGIDLFTHVAEDALNAQVAYLRDITEKAVGRILDIYQQRGVLDETYVLFVADHGHTPVLSDDRHALSTEGADEPPALIEHTGFRMRPFVLNPAEDAQDYQATVAYQGAIAYVYLADRSTCPLPGDRCDWSRPPRLKEDVMPVVRAFSEVNKTGDPIPELEGTLDLIFARTPRSTDRDALPFQIFDGKKLVPISTYLTRHRRPDLLQLDKRMKWLGAGPYGHRAGDIVLLARSGMERPIEERFYFSGPYHSWHGSPAEQDSHIPLVVARKVDSGEQLKAIVDAVVGKSPSQLHVVPLVRALMGQKPGRK